MKMRPKRLTRFIAVSVVIMGTSVTFALSRSSDLESSAPESDLEQSEVPPAGIHLDGPDQSIGEIIDSADAVVRGRLLSPQRARWNSLDGSSWHIDFQEAPNLFPVAPLPYTSFAVQVSEVLLDTTGSLGEGSTLDIRYALDSDDITEVSTPDLEAPPRPLDEQIIFLEWKTLWQAGPPGARLDGGVETEVWQGNYEQGRWYEAGSDLFVPVAIEHQYSLRRAIEAGLAAGAIEDGVPVISKADLIALITAERSSPSAATVASYAQWPWEAEYVEHIESEPAPDADP